MVIVDSQVHIWAADRPDRPWPPGRAAQAQKPYPVTKEMVLAAMDEAGVDRAVLIRHRGKVTTTIWFWKRRGHIPIASPQWAASPLSVPKAARLFPAGKINRGCSASA
jgi:hypothetical protein